MSELDAFTQSRLATKKPSSVLDDFVSTRLAAKAPKINKDEKRGRELPSPAQGFINAVSQAPLGFGDEMYGALGGLGALVTGNDIEQAYTENRDLVRGAQKQYSEDYPWTAGITGVMAGAPLAAASPFKVAPLAQGAGKLQKAWQAAKLAAASAGTGGLFGGAYGAGVSNADTVGGVTNDALKGAGVGAVVGGVAQPVLAGVGGLTRNAAIRAFGNVKNTGSINQASGQVGAIDPIGGIVDKSKEWIKRQGDAKIAEAIGQTGRALNRNPRFLPNGEEIPYTTQLADKVDKMPVGTPLAALNGQKSNELRSLDAVSLLSGRTAPVVAKVQERLIDTASKRFLNGVNKVMGNGSPDFNKSITALEQKATTESKPFYDVLDNVNVPIDDEIRSLVSRANSFVSEANSISRIKGDDFSDIRRMVDVNSGASEIPLMRLELLKRAMSDAEGELVRAGKGYKPKVIGDLRRDLMAKLEQASPTTPQGESVYRLANSKFGEPTRLIKQVEEGAKIFKKNHMDIRDEKALLNAPELEAYNIGVFRALEEKLGSPSGRNFLTDVTKNRNTAKALYETLGHDKYRQLVKILKGEKDLKSIYSVNTGSQTAGREAALSELGLDPLKDAGESVAHLMGGSPITAMGKAGQAWNKISTPEQVRDYMGKQYLLTGKESQEYLKTLGDLMKQIETKKTQRATATGTLSGLGGGQFNKPKDKK
jgi:hypothetical protein